jgi:hypothetical protein
MEIGAIVMDRCVRKLTYGSRILRKRFSQKLIYEEYGPAELREIRIFVVAVAAGKIVVSPSD